MVSRWIVGLLGLFHLLNGLWMIAAPAAWYAAVPGVTLEGPFNHHFIGDIGFAFAASGAGMIAMLWPGLRNATLALAGSVWPALHACFHVWEWITDGLPSDTHVLVSTGVGVILISYLGFALAFANARKEGVV